MVCLKWKLSNNQCSLWDEGTQQPWPNGGDKDMVWKGTPSHMAGQWPLLLAAPLQPCVCVRALLGLVLSGFLVVHPRHHHQQSLSCCHHLTHQHLFPLLSSPLVFSLPPLSAEYSCDKCYGTALTFPNLPPAVRPSGTQRIRLQMCAVPLPGPSTHQSSLMCCSKVHLNMWPHPWKHLLIIFSVTLMLKLFNRHAQLKFQINQAPRNTHNQEHLIWL